MAMAFIRPARDDLQVAQIEILIHRAVGTE
jgi:hypothetical protein